MQATLAIRVAVLAAVLKFTLAAYEIPEHMKKHAKKLHNLCQAQTNADAAIIASALTGKLPTDDKFECYVHCLFDKVGLIDEANVMHLENLLQILPEDFHEVILKLSKACGTKDGKDKCNVAYNTLNCYAAEYPPLLSENMKYLFE